MEQSTVCRILIIDDNADHISLAKHHIRRAMRNALLLGVTRWEDARDAMGSLEFDIVLLDYDMPQLDGGEILRRLQVSHPTLPVLIFSASIDEELGRRLISAGARGVITKEIDTFPLLPNLIREELDRGAGDGDASSVMERMSI